MPSATFSHTASTNSPIDDAWAALQRPETWLKVATVSSVSNPSYADDGALMRFDWVADVGGKAYGGIASTTGYHRPDRFDLTMDTSEIAGDIVTTLEGSQHGCFVTVAITFRTKGMLSAMFFPAIRQALSTGFPDEIEELVATI